MDNIDLTELKELLRTRVLGRKLIYREEVDSTNRVAKELAIKGEEEGAVVISELQKAGRGRWSRHWLSPRGGVWFSVLLRPKIELSGATILTLMGGVAVAKAVSELTGLKPSLKWPNDVMVGGRKLCGILTESASTGSQYSLVIGVGLNAYVDVKSLPGEVQKVATSLQDCGVEVSREELVSRILWEMERLYLPDVEGVDARELIRSEWREWSEIIMSRVRVDVGGEILEGIAEDVDQDGGLLLRVKDGSVRKLLVGVVSKVEKL
jgi:BirA family biotin operon repressor/biotin-[acetyl-CoA-carboxylase] ligase